MNSVRWKNLSLKYQRFTPSGGKNIGIRKSECVTKTQFLSKKTVDICIQWEQDNFGIRRLYQSIKLWCTKQIVLLVTYQITF